MELHSEAFLRIKSCFLNVACKALPGLAPLLTHAGPWPSHIAQLTCLHPTSWLPSCFEHQGRCTCCSLCLECSSLHRHLYLPPLPRHLLHVLQVGVSQTGLGSLAFFLALLTHVIDDSYLSSLALCSGSSLLVSVFPPWIWHRAN